MRAGSAKSPATRRTRVLVVDDSAIVRKLLSRELQRDPAIEVVGTAVDPYDARQKIAELRPEVLTLDVEMPRMDGITFLQALMEHYPLPVIVVSSLTEAGTQTAVNALAYGAVDVVAKPGSAYSVEALGETLIGKIKQAARTHVLPMKRKGVGVARRATMSMAETTDKIFAIGASTGGVRALTEILPMLPRNCPGTLIVQHMPPKFTKSFADRLSRMCQVEVKEAEDGDSVFPGRILIAPGGHHMVLRRSGARYYVQIIGGPPVAHQKPSVEVLFDSVANYAGANAVAAILTGMGNDGARGMAAIREAGGRTIAQDEATSVVFGMPNEAIRAGGVEKVLPLLDIPAQMLAYASKRTRATVV